MAEPLARTWSRPDIVDRARPPARHRRRRAFALRRPAARSSTSTRPSRSSTAALPGLDTAELRKSLADQSRRFVWVARGLSPRQAQRVHDLGLPGLAFRTELKRAYPLGALAGHLIGTVNTDNKGLAGLERMLDETGRVEAVQGPGRVPAEPVRLSLDIGVQHALAEELKQASLRYSAAGAARPGARRQLRRGPRRRLAARGRPVAPRRLARPGACRPARRRHLRARLHLQDAHHRPWRWKPAAPTSTSVYDVRQPLVVGTYTIKDLLPAGPAAHRARGVPALLQRRRRHAGAGGGRRAAARVPGPARPHRADAHGGGPGGAAAAAQALGPHRDRHHRLRPRPGAGAAAVRGRHGRPRQRRRQGHAHAAWRGPTTAARACASSRRPPAPSCARSCAST